MWRQEKYDVKDTSLHSDLVLELQACICSTNAKYSIPSLHDMQSALPFLGFMDTWVVAYVRTSTGNSFELKVQALSKEEWANTFKSNQQKKVMVLNL